MRGDGDVTEGRVLDSDGERQFVPAGHVLLPHTLNCRGSPPAEVIAAAPFLSAVVTASSLSPQLSRWTPGRLRPFPATRRNLSSVTT